MKVIEFLTKRNGRRKNQLGDFVSLAVGLHVFRQSRKNEGGSIRLALSNRSFSSSLTLRRNLIASTLRLGQLETLCFF
jgi:hypothetical protein